MLKFCFYFQIYRVRQTDLASFELGLRKVRTRLYPSGFGQHDEERQHTTITGSSQHRLQLDIDSGRISIF